MLKNVIFPKFTYRRLFVAKITKTVRGQASLNPFFNPLNFLQFENIKNFWNYSGTKINCNVCGHDSSLFYDFPNVAHRIDHKVGILRETLQCRVCGATMRDRTLASAMLSTLTEVFHSRVSSINDVSDSTLAQLKILDTDSFSPISTILSKLSNYVRSSYVTDKPFGIELSAKRFNINLEKIDFPPQCFDLVLTSDVSEHIRDINQAHLEIFRILRSGGIYIFTAPFDEKCSGHHILVDTSTPVDKYLVPKQIHGDPVSGGILAYRVFGRGIFSDLEKIGFKVSYKNISDNVAGIYNGDVFIACKS